ncbi:FAD-binding oxidoreductase [Mycolicibacterium phocaicum]|uniref:FAD-binding oxidoreductase n=2 Tax=Mycobacteriaceae TaxID=1762 RepID=UPI001CF9AEAC|nr:FAD-binding oxidoreductase [Mycolicibacterium phocaicum]UCZ59356.1 FAD-binding oxidoreductase [Mycolicibacterium phocaicum]
MRNFRNEMRSATMSELTMPVAASPGRLDEAIAAFSRAIGPEHVHTDDATLAEFSDPYSPSSWDDYRPPVVLQPATVEEIQAIVRIANEYTVSLWTNSQGRNNAYGGSSPRMPGTVVVNLRRMNRVLEVNDELGYVVVEPGVSFNDLYAYVREHGHDVWIDVPDLGWGSVLGNTMDHGFGYTRYGDHAAAQCGMEVVLANGELLRTGLGALGAGDGWHVSKRGFGPSADGIFMQSNFGIVTKIGLWVMRRPDFYIYGFITVPQPDDIAALVEALRPLLLDGTIPNQPEVFNDFAALAEGAKKADVWPNPGRVPAEVLDGFRKKSGAGAWNLRFALYGREEIVDVNLAAVRSAIAHIPGSTVNGQKLRGDDREAIEALGQPGQVQAGVPSMSFLSVMDWVGAKKPGHVCLSSIAPLRGADVLKIRDIVRDACAEYGYDYGTGITLSPRHLTHISTLFYDAEDPVAVRSAYDFCREVIVKAREAGFAEYRAHIDFMDHVADQFDWNNHALLRFNETLKDALDPNGILAPGKSGIWPKRLRVK